MTMDYHADLHEMLDEPRPVPASEWVLAVLVCAVLGLVFGALVYMAVR